MRRGERPSRGWVVAVLAVLALGLVVVPARPAAADLPAVHLPAPDRPRVTMIGDSTLAGVRWLKLYGSVPGAYDVILDAESCRRTDYQGCVGREGYAPISAVQELEVHRGQLGPFVVAMVGYNDSAEMFAAAIDRFMAEALRQGVQTVFWVTFRVSVRYRSPFDWSNDGTFRIHNQTLADRVTRYGGRLQLIDWNAYSADHPEWVHDDGVHLTLTGAPILMSFIRSELDRYRTATGPGPHLLGTPADPVPGPARAPGSVVAVPPVRILDTRDGAPVAPGTSITVPVAGRDGIPGDAVALVANLTATEADRDGFATLWPAGEPRPLASSVNISPTDTRANLAVVALGTGGAVELYSLARAHYVLDVTGYVVAAPDPVTAGRFLPAPPTRLYDSRDLGPALPAGSVVRVAVPQVATASGAAAFLTVTATEAAGPGFVTLWPGTGPLPLASSLNVLAGSTRANTALVPVGPDGMVSLFTSAELHLVVDLAGVVSGPEAGASTAGRLVVTSPRRFADSRTGVRALAPTIGAQVAVGGRGGVPADATAVLANVTMADTAAPGWLAVWGAGPWPGTSTANAEQPRRVVAATHVSLVDPSGAVSLAANVVTEVVYDVSGWFTP